MNGKTRHITILCAVLLSFFATSVQSQSTEALMRTGGELLRNGAFQQAVSQFNKVLARNPGHFEARFNVGIAYLQLGKYSQAITEFKKASSVNSQNAEVWINMGFAYNALGQTKSAVNALTNAVNVEPSNIDARTNLASMYVTLNKTNEAISQYKNIIQMDGTNTVAYINLAACLVSKKRIDEAKGYLEKAIAYDPNTADAYQELARIYWKHEKDPETALKKITVAIRLKPLNPAYHETRALIYESIDSTDAAITAWEECRNRTDDALKKDDIDTRITQLRDSEQSDTPRSAKAQSALTKENIAQLKKEVRATEEDTPEEKVITTEGLDVMGDLDGFFDEEEAGETLDLKQEAKRRAKKE